MRNNTKHIIKGYSQKQKSIVPSDRILLFLIWPFAALVDSLKNFRRGYAKNLFWMFCIFYGFAFVYEDPSLGGFGADSARYAADVIELHDQPISIQALLGSIYSPETEQLDIYKPLVTWLVSIFSGNPRVLFMVFATVFGFFYSRNLWMVFESVKRPVSVLLFLLMFYLALINPIWNINGVRMWTASQVFIYGVLRYLLKGDKKGLLWIAGSMLFHFSLMLPIFLFFAWFFLPKNINLYFGLYILTAFMYEIDLAQARNVLSFLPSIFQPRVEGYTNEGYSEVINAANQNLALHVKLSGIFTNWLIYIWVFILFIKQRRWEKILSPAINVFTLALMLGSFANIAAGVPSGSRYLVLSGFLFFVVIIMLLGQRKQLIKLQWLEYLSIPLLAFLVIFKIRMGFDFTGILTFIGNPFLAVFVDSQTPIIEFIKGIF